MLILTVVVPVVVARPGTPHRVQAETPSIRAIAVAGQPAPGGGSFEHFSVESLPIVAPVNRRQQVAFFATLLRGKASEAIFLGSSERVVRIVAEGDAAPGGGAFSGFGRHPIPALNDAGTVAFAASVAGGKAVEGIFVLARSRMRPVAVTGSPAPGIPGGTFANLDQPALNERGDVAFLATVRRGRESVEAIYLHAGGALRKVALQGDPAPAGGTFAGFGAPVVNGKRTVAFAAIVEGRGVPGGVFLAEGERITMAVGAGDETPVGGIFAKLSERVTLNDAGTIAFIALLKGARTEAAVFTAQRGRPDKIAALGDAAPGGGHFSHFGLWPALTDDGAVGFVASVDGGETPVAIFVARVGGATTRVVGIGDVAGSAGRIVSLGLYPMLAMSRRGALTFATAPGTTGEGPEGIFLTAAAR